MARSDVDHYRLLNRWPIIMHENNWHFNQAQGTGAPLTGQCDEVMVQWERDYIANALNWSVQIMAEHLNFYPRPVYVSERVHLGRGAPYQWQQLETRWKYLQAFGSRATALIEAGASVVYSDPQGLGVDTLATITVTTSYDADEIAVFFKVADGAAEAASQYWQIEPLTVTKSGNTATITGPRWLFVKPAVWAQEYEEPNYTEKNKASTTDAANFVTEVDVYRLYTDAEGAVTINTDPLLCSCDCTTLAGNETTSGVARIVDERLGLFQLRRCPCTCGCYWPESVDIHYLAGYPLADGGMARALEIAAIRLANTNMPQLPDSFCDRTLQMWQLDMQNIDPGEFTRMDMHPFGGTKRGRIEAWNQIRHLALGMGGKLTQRWA